MFNVEEKDCRNFGLVLYLSNDEHNVTILTNIFRCKKLAIKKKKKNLVFQSHNFLLPYIMLKEYFINSIAFIFKLYFICFIVDEFRDFIIIVYNF